MKPPRRTSLGELRPTQLLYTFGVGAVVDLPHVSVMIMGLEDWDFARARPIKEDRLLAQVRRRLGGQVQGLATPPMREDIQQGFVRAFDDNDVVGVPVAPFPRWMRCPACNLLAPLKAGLFRIKTVPGRPDLAKYVHVNCNKLNQPAVLPARFLFACESGHLDDFPWHWFVHHGKTGCHGILELRELGVSGEAADVEVRCRECDQRRRMADAFGSDAHLHLPTCRGRRPHLRDFEDEACKSDRQTILLGASNSWFPLTLTTLYVPPSAQDELGQMVEAKWNELADVDNPSILAFLRKQGQLGSLASNDDEALWEAIKKRREATSEEEVPDNIKEPEWRVFAEPDPDFNAPDFQLREVNVPRQWQSIIEKVVLAERLREVTALTAFTRIGSPRDYAEEFDVPSKVLAPLSRNPAPLVPASEVRGEGIFIKFKEDAISAWCEAHAEVEEAFRTAHTAWRRRRSIDPPEAGFPGLRYVLLHSFAHVLMRELALECGYTAASIRERIYARDAEGESDPMAGVLLYTAAPDSEGTLGGLVRMGLPHELGNHIGRALEHVRLCSSDPLCADHLPDADGTTLHGSVCHACLFAPETSCERGNKYLDRGVLIETIRGAGKGFYEV